MSQLFPLPRYYPPNENFVRIGPVFNVENPKDNFSLARATDMITGQMFDRKMKFEYGGIGDGAHNGTVDHKVRKSGVYFVEANRQIEWIFQAVGELIARVNYEKFANMDLEYLEALQYTSYKAPEQPEENAGHYHWHVDAHSNVRRQNERKLSIVIGMSDPDTYEGGDLLINHLGNQNDPATVRLRQGEAVIFYSHLPHCVTPVTKGERRSLVSWILGPRLV